MCLEKYPLSDAARMLSKLSGRSALKSGLLRLHDRVSVLRLLLRYRKTTDGWPNEEALLVDLGLVLPVPLPAEIATGVVMEEMLHRLVDMTF